VETREITPDYTQGHLVVAAIRVLEHRGGKPPTMEEVGQLLGISHEVVGAVARALAARGIVKIHMTPFDTRVEAADHTALEELPREGTGAAMQSELDAFQKRRQEKQEKMEQLLGGGYQKKKAEKHAGLDAQLKEWQKKRAVNPFASGGAAESDGSDAGDGTEPPGGVGEGSQEESEEGN